MRFDLNEILRSLPDGPREGVPVPPWLAASWTDPDGFAAALAAPRSGSMPTKSQPGQQVDFFHDLAVRHAGSDRVALRAYDRSRGWQSLSYRQLHDRSSRRATSWAAQKVKAGAKVCLLYEVGPELLISLLAGLRLGACVSFLQPRGAAFVARRIGNLAPDHLAAEPHQAPLFKGFEKLLLREPDSAEPGFASHTYRPREPVALVFSPLVDPPDRGVMLAADDAFRAALVDGLLTFALGAGDVLAAPGFASLQHLPALLFATLLRGATFLHLELSDLARDPSLLRKERIQVLGVAPELRDLLLRQPAGPLPGLVHWFRNPEEPLDWISWGNWIEHAGLAKVPTSNVLVDPAAGGSVLASERRPGAVHADLAPAPGRRWELRDLNLSGQPAPGDMGIFTTLPDKGRPPGYVVLSRLRGRLHYAGTRSARREGRVFPAAEVVDALEGMAGLLGASVVAVPTSGAPARSSFVLLVFVGGKEPPPHLREIIQRHLELQLGAERLPDRLEVVPLHPHRRKGKVDDVWCKAQYLTGAFHRKANDPMFLALTGLRDELLAPGARGRAG